MSDVVRIARLLGESDPVPLQIIGRMVRVLGADAVEQLAQEALAIDARGGEYCSEDEALTTRRRTVGGIFFRLAKDRLPRQLRRHVIYGARLGPRPAPAPAAPPPPPAPEARPRGPIVTYVRRRQRRLASESGL